MSFDKSRTMAQRFRASIPGGAHTYAKGDDQYPGSCPPYIDRGLGCHVWDVDGNEFIEYGMGLRAVTLGHAYAPVVDAAHKAMLRGTNFVRPARIELECAEELLSLIEGAEMVKFAKNGSDVNDAAIRLSRAYTGRDLVAVCSDHPFFSVSDWFIGTTAMAAGIPGTIKALTRKFRYNDTKSLRRLFAEEPARIACVILEPEKETPPKNDFLHEAQRLCRENGTVFILDEMITGFRWHNGGAQRFHNIVPDLSTFGKALGNGFSVSALAGKKEIMRLGGLDHERERVFLLSTTHGAESHGLAAAMETMRTYKREPVIDTLWRQGQRLAQGIRKSVTEHRLETYFEVTGRPCCLVYATRDETKQASRAFRTLFLQETIKRGILAPSLVVSYAHTDADIDRTIEAIHEALGIYRKALDEGVSKFMIGPPVKTVYRQYG